MIRHIAAPFALLLVALAFSLRAEPDKDKKTDKDYGDELPRIKPLSVEFVRRR